MDNNTKSVEKIEGRRFVRIARTKGFDALSSCNISIVG